MCFTLIAKSRAEAHCFWKFLFLFFTKFSLIFHPTSEMQGGARRQSELGPRPGVGEEVSRGRKRTSDFKNCGHRTCVEKCSPKKCSLRMTQDALFCKAGGGGSSSRPQTRTTSESVLSLGNCVRRTALHSLVLHVCLDSLVCLPVVRVWLAERKWLLKQYQ